MKYIDWNSPVEDWKYIHYGGMSGGKSRLMQKFALDWLKKNPNGEVLTVGFEDVKGAKSFMNEFIKYFGDEI